MTQILWSSLTAIVAVALLFCQLAVAPSAWAACGQAAGYYGFLLEGVTSNCENSQDNGGFRLDLFGNLQQQGCQLSLSLDDSSDGVFTEVIASGTLSGTAWSGSVSIQVSFNQETETGTGSFSGSLSGGDLDVTFQTQITNGDTCRTNGRLQGLRLSDLTTTTTMPTPTTTEVVTSTTLPGPCSGQPLGTPCDDGIFCNGADTCLGGECSVHAGDPCANTGVCSTACSEANDNCPGTQGDPCSDGDPCNGDEVCDDHAQCVAGEALDCSDDNICTADFCDAGVGCRNAEVEGACPLCGDTNRDGKIFANDALYVLGVAVGRQVCQRAICDADGNGRILAADALTVLRRAVGLLSDLDCPEPGLILSGTVAHGRPASEGTKVCATTYTSEDGEFLLEEEVDCTLTDATGGWFLNLPDLEEGAATIQAFLDDPLGHLFSGWFSDDDSKDNETVNVNPVTDLAMISMGDKATDGDSESPEDCYNDCATALAHQARDGGFENALTGAQSFYGELSPGGDPSGWLSAPFDPDPLMNPRDAMLEQAGLDYERPQAVLTNVRGEEMARARLGDIADNIVDPADAVDAGQAARAVRARGGFGEALIPDGTKKFACWKEFRNGNGILARVEDTCVADPATCTGSGGETGDSPHPDEATCIARCQANALGPPELASAEEPFCPTAEFFDKACVDTLTAGTTVETLDFQQACDAGSVRGCACRDEAVDVECPGSPLDPRCCVSRLRSFDTLCPGSQVLVRTCYHQYPDLYPRLVRTCSCASGKIVNMTPYELEGDVYRPHGFERHWRCDNLAPSAETRWQHGERFGETFCDLTGYRTYDANGTEVDSGGGCPIQGEAPDCPEDMLAACPP